MQPNYVDFLHSFKPVNTSAKKRPVGRPKNKPVDQPLTTNCTRLTIDNRLTRMDWKLCDL